MSHVTLVFVILALISCKKSEQPSVQKVDPQAQAKVTSFVSPIDQIAARRATYHAGLSLEKITLGHAYTDEYFANLNVRKQAVITWAEKHKPVITFVGQIHMSLTGGNTPVMMDLIYRSQTAVFDALRQVAPKSDLIVYEDVGTDAPLSPALQVETTHQNLVARHAMHPEAPLPRKDEIQEMFAQDVQAVTRAIREFTHPPIFCGEEWPIVVQSEIMRIVNPTPEEKILRDEFIEQFNRLRSEIIVIRALEFLKARGGRRAIIVQGADHGLDMPGLAQIYRFGLIRIMPPD